MTEELIVEEIEDCLRTRPSSMKQIYRSLQKHPALEGMDQARAMRKIRNTMKSSKHIFRLGEKRGSVYSFNPEHAEELEVRGQIENEIIKIHLTLGGTLKIDDEHYSKLDGDYESERVDDALEALRARGILRITRSETSLTERVWDISGITIRSSSSFTHTGATGLIIDELIEKLENLNREGVPFIADSEIPVPRRPSRSAAIEAAVAYTSYILRNR